MSQSTRLGQLRRTSTRILTIIALFGAIFCVFNLQTRGQAAAAASADPPSTPHATLYPTPRTNPQTWVNAAVQHQLEILQDQSFPLRYQIRKINQKVDITRVVIESKEGNVARLIQVDGHPLTADEDVTERKRLNDILSSPNDYLKHEKDNRASLDYALQVIKLMPRAMIYTYTPGQPQPPHAMSRQVVIDFHPNPAFKPPTMVSELLTGLEGRVWIDERTGRLTRAEGHVLRVVKVGWGIIAKVYPGGTVEFEQTCVDGRHWAFSHLETNLDLRVMLVRSVTDKTQMSAWGFEPLHQPISFQEAVHELLAMPVKLR